MELAVGPQRIDHSNNRSRERDGPFAPQTIAGKIDAVGVVDQAIEDRIGVGRIADQGMPLVDGDLAGDDG